MYNLAPTLCKIYPTAQFLAEHMRTFFHHVQKIMQIGAWSLAVSLCLNKVIYHIFISHLNFIPFSVFNSQQRRKQRTTDQYKMAVSFKYWDDCLDPEDMRLMWQDPVVSKEWNDAGEEQGQKVHLSRDPDGEAYLTQTEMMVRSLLNSMILIAIVLEYWNPIETC